MTHPQERSQSKTKPHIVISNVYTIVAGICCIFFIIFFYLKVGSLFLSGIMFLTLIGVIINYIILKQTKKYEIATYTLLSMASVVMFSLFAEGWADIGLIWPFAWLPGAFSVNKGKSGKFFVLIFFIVSSVIITLHIYGMIILPYSAATLTDFLVVFAVFSLLMILYHNANIHYKKERDKVVDELIQKSSELAYVNKELEQFSYAASHDLQEPLRTITNFVELLKEAYSGKEEPGTEKYFTFITNACERMQTLIKDLLEFSRVGRLPVFISVDCNKILKEVIAEMDVSIKESNAKITFSVLPVLKGSEIELKRLFQNLISNAIKFRKKTVPPEIVISAEEKDIEYVFSIKDNGIGIEEQNFKKLFISFQRLHSTEEYPGTGIGLAICKKIVDLHNGKIWVDSKLGVGSTFYFTIHKLKNDHTLAG